MAQAIELFPTDMRIELPWLLERLLRESIISEEDAALCRASQGDQKDDKLHPIQVLARLNIDNLSNKGTSLSAKVLTNWLAGKAQQSEFQIDPLKMNIPAITAVMSYAFAQRHQILATEVGPDYVVIGSTQPFLKAWEPDLQQTLKGKDIRRVVLNPEDYARYSVEFYNLARSVSGAHKHGQSGGSGAANFEQLLELGKLSSLEANDQHVVSIVDWLLQYAFEQRASDIHLEPRRDSGRVRFRIDGVLHDVNEFPANVMAAISSRIKILGRMNVAEKRRPQDGRIKTRTPAGSEVELRLATLPTAFGEKLVMRIFDPDVLLRSYQEMGLSRDDYQKWLNLVHQTSGIVLVTGPTGSGKTTTLYSTLKQLATPEVNVCTVEDPIEMVEPSFNQMQVQNNIELDFASGLRALMRQDPDIIMVGEIRDLETANMAIQAALTGHLVISTLHTNDAPAAVTRLLDLGVPPYLVASTVLGIMAQRLVRTFCPHCKQEGPLNEEAWASLTQPWKSAPPEKVFHAKGCIECRETGYLGRSGIYEILPFTETFKRQIGQNCNIVNLRKQAYKEGMLSLRLSGAQKVAAGLTSIEEVMRVAPAFSIHN